MRDQAKNYLALGLSVIPVGTDKRPLFSWKEFQTRLASLDEVNMWFDQYPNANLAVVTGLLSGVCIIDIDDPRAGLPELAALIPSNLRPLVVKTPRGGFHWYFKMPEKALNNNAKTIIGCDFRGEGGYALIPPSRREDGVKYTFVKEMMKSTIKDTLDSLPVLPDTYINYVVSTESMQAYTSTGQLFTVGQRDTDIFHAANLLVKGGATPDFATECVRRIAQTCNFPEREADLKVWSALQRIERKHRNITQEIRDWVELQHNYLTITNCYTELHLLQKEEKNATRVCFNRMVKEGILAHDSKGAYRRVNNEVIEIDYENADPTSLDMTFPLDIHKLAKVHRKNIIMVAGTSNAGKTAFLMNMAELNMHKFDVHYFSSEMGAEELRGRIDNHRTPRKEWRWHVYERAENFADVIRPDAINIIDYMEVVDEAYRVPTYIRNIFHKLNNGICLIALQKKPGLSDGVGGFQTRDKARLYITIEKDTLKLEKVKHRSCADNPTGAEIKFELVNHGTLFIPKSEWLMNNTRFMNCDYPEGYDPHQLGG